MKNRPFLQRSGFAIAGIVHALRAEQSFRTQVAAAVAILGVLAWLRPAPLWWALVILTVALVLAAELFNTAIEVLADHLHPEQHPRIRIMKDCAAGAVLVASLGALGVAAALLVDTLTR
jgi:diacylglycerol kinase (ATP)